MTNQPINKEHAAAAIAAMYRDGIVVWVLVGNAVNVEHVDNLNRILILEDETLASLPTTHFNNVCVVYSIAINHISYMTISIYVQQYNRGHCIDEEFRF